MKKNYILLVVLLFTGYSSISQTELKYDNGTSNISWYGLNAQTQQAVRFSPTGPCNILNVQYYVRTTNAAAANFGVFIYDWDGNAPDQTIYSEAINAVTGNYEDWRDHSVGSGVSSNGEFVVAFKNASATLELAYDANLSTGRNWEMSGGTWSSASASTWLIRATVEYANGIVEELVGESFNLYPNPASNAVTVNFELNKTDNVLIKLYNGQGALIKQMEKTGISGLQQFTWNTEKYEDGFYYFTLETGETRIVRKLIIIQ